MKTLMFTGARDSLIKSEYKRAQLYNEILGTLFSTFCDLVIVGCASGVDQLVRKACLEYNKVYLTHKQYLTAKFTANWNKHGKSAGMIRNREMCESMQTLGGTILFAFPAPNSRGTWNCIRTGLFHNLEVIISPILYSHE